MSGDILVTTSKNLPPNAPFVDITTGYLTRPANNYLNNLTFNTNAATAGSVTTDPGSGLAGGGSVADGISIFIAPNGVSNAMLRQSAGTSIIGRAAGSSGNVADITADANMRVLSREGNQLAFRSFINGVSLGLTTAAPLVRTDELEITTSASASVATVSHSIPVTIAGTTYYMLLSITP